jgi:hypothetical protein
MFVSKIFIEVLKKIKYIVDTIMDKNISNVYKPEASKYLLYSAHDN